MIVCYQYEVKLLTESSFGRVRWNCGYCYVEGGDGKPFFKPSHYGLVVHTPVCGWRIKQKL